MRIAVLIIGLLLGFLMFLQTVLIYAGSSATEQEDLAGSAAIGIFMAVIWLVACALVIAFPMFSAGMFIAAGALGLLAAGTSEFEDLYIWAGISFGLAFMAILGGRGKKKAEAAIRAEHLRRTDHEERMETLLRQQRDHVRFPNPASHTPAQNFCTSCGVRNEPGSRFCAECGAALTPATLAATPPN